MAFNKTLKSSRGSSFLLFILIILILIGLSPFIAGILFKRNYEHFLSALSEETGADIRIINYQMGWLKSTAELEVTLQNHAKSNNKTAANFTLDKVHCRVTQDISHGPLVYDSIEKKYRFAEAMIQSNFTNFKVNAVSLSTLPIKTPNFVTETRVDFAGGFANHLVILPFKFDLSSRVTLNWEGLEALIYLRTNTNQIKLVKSSINIKAFSFEASDIKLHLQGLTTHSSWHRDSMGLWQGEDQVTLPALSYQNKGKLYRLLNYQISNVYGTQQNKYHIKWLNRFDELDLPNLKFSAMEHTANFDNFNAKALSELMTIVNNHEDANKTTALDNMLPRLIMPDTMITMVFKMNSSSGKVTADGKILWPPNTPLPKTVDDIRLKVQAEANLRIPVLLVKQVIELMDGPPAQSVNGTLTPEALSPTVIAQPPAQNPAPPSSSHQATDMLNQLIAAGYLIQDNADYVSHIQYSNGVLKINNKTP